MHFTGIELANQPEPHHLEVSIIGPGYGECVLIHIGDGHWIIIDSCVTDSGIAPISYLNNFSADCRKVVAIVVSHWDEDHARGLAKIVETFPEAKLVISRVLGKDAFVKFVQKMKQPMKQPKTQRARSGVEEFAQILDHCAHNKRSLIGASSNRRIIEPRDIGLSHNLPIEVWTLSPSDGEMDRFLYRLARQMPIVGETRRVASSRKDNHLSVCARWGYGNAVWR